MITGAIYAERRITVDSAFTIALIAPVFCNNLSIRNNGPSVLYVIPDLTLPTQRDDIGPGVQKVLKTSGGASNSPVFQKSSTICWLQFQSGVGEVIVSFLL